MPACRITQAEFYWQHCLCVYSISYFKRILIFHFHPFIPDRPLQLIPQGPGHVHAGAGAGGGVRVGGGGGAVLRDAGHAPGQEQGRHPHAHQGRDTRVIIAITTVNEPSKCLSAWRRP